MTLKSLFNWAHGALFGLLLFAGTTSCDLEMDASQSDDKGNGPIAVLFHLSGPMPQFSNMGGPFTPPGMSQERFAKLMKRAQNDVRVQEIVIHLSNLNVGWARAKELSDIISDVSKTDPVTCLLESADNKTYWLAATGCPTIKIAPAGSVDIVGLSVESVFVKDLLDSLGIKADMLSVGKYKSAAENVTRSDMSDAAREATTSILNSLYEEFVNGISKGRGIDKSAVSALIDNGPYTAKQAKKDGLVDDVMPLSRLLVSLTDKHTGGVKSDYGKEPPKPLNLTDIMKMFSGEDEERRSNASPKIAVIPVIGTIHSGMDDKQIFGGDTGVYDIPLITTLLKAADDETVKAVVLRIDSPGGSALASDNIWEAVKTVAKKKPVIASMGDIAASGGYYIASAATEVYSSNTTLTGSIGVVGGKVVLGEGLAKLGINNETIAKGQRASILSPFHPFTEDEKKVITQSMKSIYYLFVHRVVTGRKLKKEDVLAHAEGRVWTGAQAIGFGLVDKEGTLQQAISRARELTGLPGIEAQLYPKPKNFMEVLTEQLTGQDAQLRFLQSFPAGRQALNLGILLSKERVLTVSPLLFDIR